MDLNLVLNLVQCSNLGFGLAYPWHVLPGTLAPYPGPIEGYVGDGQQAPAALSFISLMCISTHRADGVQIMLPSVSLLLRYPPHATTSKT